MRFSKDVTFNVAQDNKSAKCNREGGAVSKDILMKIICKNL
jgi:hypothetical protein